MMAAVIIAHDRCVSTFDFHKSMPSPLLQCQGRPLQGYRSWEEAYAIYWLPESNTIQSHCDFRNFMITAVLHHWKEEGVSTGLIIEAKDPISQWGSIDNSNMKILPESEDFGLSNIRIRIFNTFNILY